jgi:hypothetical protein
VKISLPPRMSAGSRRVAARRLVSLVGPGLPVAITLALAACGPSEPAPTPPMLSQASVAQAVKAASEKATAAVRECADKRQSGELKTHVASVECSNPRVLAAYQEAHYPFMDLIQVQTAARLDGAKKIDSGELTDAEYQREADELAGRVKAEIHLRLEATAPGTSPAQVSQVEPQTAQALLQGLPGLQSR